MGIEVREFSDNQFGRCVRISNGIIEASVTIESGPRIIHYGFMGEENQLFQDPAGLYDTRNEELEHFYGNGAYFHMAGGHRLWAGPERMPQTYYPDNEPVVYGILHEGVSFTPPRQKNNDLQFQFEIMMGPEASDIMIVHSVKNCGKERCHLALWPITAMKPGGVAILPCGKMDDPYQPSRLLALWPYSKAEDPRFFHGDRFITLRQNPAIQDTFKVGVNNTLGWVAYANQGATLLTRYVHTPQTRYPDMGCSSELYVNGAYLNLETLSPLYGIEPGCAVRHVENQSLFHSNAIPDARDEDGIQAFLEKLA